MERNSPSPLHIQCIIEFDTNKDFIRFKNRGCHLLRREFACRGKKKINNIRMYQSNYDTDRVACSDRPLLGLSLTMALLLKHVAFWAHHINTLTVALLLISIWVLRPTTLPSDVNHVAFMALLLPDINPSFLRLFFINLAIHIAETFTIT